jgi:rubrerythrin
MSYSVSASELVELAKIIESCGEAFYAAAVEAAAKPAVRALFARLRDEEATHRDALAELAAQVGDDGESWGGDEAQAEYMRALAAYPVFPDPEAARALVTAVDGEAAVLRHAINFEKDTILFLHELRTMGGTEVAVLVDRLLAEERGHLRLLADLMGKVRS